MERKFLLGTFLASLFAMVSTASATASQVVITDCNGIVRAASETKPGSLSSVTMKFASAVQSEVKLNSLLGAASKVTLAKDGQALFDGVTAGQWSACQADANLAIEQVSIVTTSESNSALGSAAAIGAGVLGGGAAIIGLGGNSGSGDTPATATLVGSKDSGAVFNENDGLAKDGQVQAQAAHSTGRPARTAADCLNNTEVDPISPFL